MVLSGFIYDSSGKFDVHAFSDVPNDHWAYATIQWAVDQGIVTGYEDGTFRPNQVVTEAEFLVMLMRAYPEVDVQEEGVWYAGAYAFAESYNWPVLYELKAQHFNRGQVAVLVSATQGHILETHDAIQYLLDTGLSQGKTSATIEGYDASSMMTRAESLTFIKNMKDQQFSLKPATDQTSESPGPWELRGVTLGQNESQLIQLLGEPDRKDPSIYGFTWYIYNENLLEYAQFGVLNGTVVAMYSNANVWTSSYGVQVGSTDDLVNEKMGQPIEYIQKGNVRYLLDVQNEEPVYHLDQMYVTLFKDAHQNDQVMAILIVDEQVEESFVPDEALYTDEIRMAFERQVFDLSNVTRAQYGLEPFAWHEQAAETARGHSQHMAEDRFFDHTSPDGSTLGDRLQDQQVSFHMAGENIAAGQFNALFAHSGWMNSLGHRQNILGSYQDLGVGVYFGGPMRVYYTQNFITP